MCRPALIVLAFAAALLQAQKTTLELETKTYISPDGGYSIDYPGNWTIESRAAGFRIYNFAIRDIRPQLLLPRHGALIALGGRPRGVNSLADWIDGNARHRTADSREILRVQFRAARSALDVIEIATHWKGGNETFEQIDWYFSLEGELFNGQLLFAQAYKETFKMILSSLRVNH